MKKKKTIADDTTLVGVITEGDDNQQGWGAAADRVVWEEQSDWKKNKGSGHKTDHTARTRSLSLFLLDSSLKLSNPHDVQYYLVFVCLDSVFLDFYIFYIYI